MTPHVRAGERLKDELHKSAEMAGCTLTALCEISQPWASATFVGGRHWMMFRIDGDAKRAWLDMLDEDSVYLPGYVLAELAVCDVAVTDGELTALVRALTVQEMSRAA